MAADGDPLRTLQQEMEALRIENKMLKDKVEREKERNYQLRQESVISHAQAEQEEEAVTLRLMKSLEQLKQEKEAAMRQIEEEEEYLTNTLQKKLADVRKEKIDLENELEAETEFIVNKLQKELRELRREKEAAEAALALKEADFEEMQAHLRGVQAHQEQMTTDLARVNRDHITLQQRYQQLQETHTRLIEDQQRTMTERENEEERLFNRGSPQTIVTPTRGIAAIGAELEANHKSPRRTMSLAQSPTASHDSGEFLALDPSQIVRSGWLDKRNEISHQYERRFFVLYSTGQLVFYDSDALGAMRGLFQLAKLARVVAHETAPGDPPTLLALVSPARTVCLRSDSEAARDGWLQAVQGVMSSVKRAPTSGGASLNVSSPSITIR